jgi:hypothetical protein
MSDFSSSEYTEAIWDDEKMGGMTRRTKQQHVGIFKGLKRISGSK